MYHVVTKNIQSIPLPLLSILLFIIISPHIFESEQRIYCSDR